MFRPWLLLLLISAGPIAYAEEAAPSRWRLGVANTNNFTTSDSLSAQYALKGSWVQAFGSVPRWEKNFDWSAGGAWVFNFSGTMARGFHLGPLIGAGEKNLSAFQFAAVAIGAHYTYDDFIFFAVDAGPTLNSYHSGRIVDFKVRPFGGLLGLSIHFNLD